MKCFALRNLLAPAIIGVAGCAGLTADEIRQQGLTATVASALEPAAAAQCIAHNAEAISGRIAASERSLERNHFEVLVRSAGLEITTTIAVADISPRASAGSEIVVAITPGALAPETLRKQLVGGC